MLQRILAQKFYFILIAIIYAAFFIFHQSTNTNFVQVLGASSNLVLFEQPYDGRSFMLNAIQNAKSNIDVEIYLLSDKQIIAGLTDARKRGVLVRVLLEEHPVGGSGTFNGKAAQILRNSGVLVEWTNSAYALTHEKAVVVDSNEVFIMNQNLTASSFGKNREFDIVDNNLQDAQEIDRMFAADWQRQSFVPTDGTLVVSPNNSRSTLVSLLQSSHKSIVVEMEYVEDAQILQILSDKTKTADVRVILPDLKHAPANAGSIKELEKNNVRVQTISSPYIHAKMAVVDGEKAYVGSVNFTTQSMDQNRELGIIVSQSDIVAKLGDDFEKDWQISVGD